MARHIMILIQANPLLGPLEGVGPEIETFLGPEIAMSDILAQKSRNFQGPHLSVVRVMDLPPSKSLNPSAL